MKLRRLDWAVVSFLLLACTLPAQAAGVQARSASSEAAFALGVMDGTAIDEEGHVRLAPSLETLWGPEEGIVWAVQPAGERAAFVALSGPGRVLRVAAGRDPEPLYHALDDGLITAMVADGRGGVIIGLSPEGRLLHLDGQGGESLTAQTTAKFIWALARAADGTLWIGTGVPGQLLRLRPGSELETVFETGDDPVRCIVLEEGGRLVVGTGGRGKVIRISAEGRPFVLLDAEETEIVSLVTGPDGSIFALAADGRKRPSAAPPKGMAGVAIEAPSVAITVRPPAEDGEESQEADEQPAPPTKPQPGRFKSTAGGVLYRLLPDGSTRKIWQTDREIPFALSLMDEGKLLVATGDEGRLWMLDDDGNSSKLLRISSRQASTLARGEGGQLLIGGTTDARVELLGPGPRAQGSYLTSTVDAGGVADWGRLRWEAILPDGTKLAVKARSGNSAEADDTWSEWQALGEGAREEGVATDLPPARWFQARFDLSSRNDRSPLLSSVEIFFQPRNRSPQVTLLAVERAGIAWVRGPVQSSSRQGPLVADDPVTRQLAATLKRGSRTGNVIRRSYEQGVRTLTWKAEDADGDRLRYSLEVRREGDADWFPLVNKIEDEFFSWDVRAMQDGHYRVRLTADDSRDNPEGADRADQRISEAFLIDNSRPTVGAPKVARSGGACRVSILADDPGGSVVSAEVAFDGGSWKPVYARDGVADSASELFEFECPAEMDAASATSTMMVRVTDAAGNLGGGMWLMKGR
jgi:sugar lactone lactonase YvrE